MGGQPGRFGVIHFVRAALSRRLVRWGLLLIVLLGIVCVFWRPLFWNNEGVVDPGFVYRSAQPGSDFRRFIQEKGLRSVLNLRGGTEYDPWYAAEVCRAHEENVVYHDLLLSPVRRPSRRQLRALVDILERCEYPLLIHCKWGSDRTGMASALYLMQIRGKPPREALRAFSLKHLHVPFGGPGNLHTLFYEYDAYLQRQGVTHTPARFRAWVEREYNDDGSDDELDPLLRLRQEQVANAHPGWGR